MKIEAEVIAAPIEPGKMPGLIPDVRVGDEYEMTGTAHILGVEDELVDVTSYGSNKPEFIVGDRQVKILITNARFVPKGYE